MVLHRDLQYSLSLQNYGMHFYMEWCYSTVTVHCALLRNALIWNVDLRKLIHCKLMQNALLYGMLLHIQKESCKLWKALTMEWFLHFQLLSTTSTEYAQYYNLHPCNISSYFYTLNLHISCILKKYRNIKSLPALQV